MKKQKLAKYKKVQFPIFQKAIFSFPEALFCIMLSFTAIFVQNFFHRSVTGMHRADNCLAKAKEKKKKSI